MKKYIVINGTTVYHIEKKSDSDARHWAINYCDHSLEVIVREYTEIVPIVKI